LGYTLVPTARLSGKATKRPWSFAGRANQEKISGPSSSYLSVGSLVIPASLCSRNRDQPSWVFEAVFLEGKNRTGVVFSVIK
jgi:hypothetical protein